MHTYFQVIAAVLVTVILIAVLRENNGETAALLSVAMCCMGMAAAAVFLEPVLDFWKELKELGQISNVWLQILTKVVGIGLLSEIAVLVCSDSGNDSLGKVIQILSSAVILWLSIPLLRELLELIQTILGEV